ncbi:hypothetical protein HG530_013596 [Fusarium avenaceum]|nr:hypothetical protein HG530_013596 [Fusarium avenaceum]
MRALHVLVDLLDGDVEVEVKRQDRACHQNHKDGESSILKIRDLDLHGTELDSPADAVVGRRRLKAHVLPVSGLNVLKVIRLAQVQLLKVFFKDDNRVSNEEMGKMSCQAIIHTALKELSAADLVPPHIGVGKEPLIDGCGGGQGQHDGTQWAELVVKHSSFGDILSLESDLETATAHSEGHGIHVDEVIRGSSVPHIVIFRPVMLIKVDSGILPGFRGVLVVIDGNIDLNLATPSRTNIGC